MAKVSLYSVGQKVFRLTILERVRHGKRGEWRWRCSCECGVDRSVFVNDSLLSKGLVKSCGCYSADNRNTSGFGSGWKSNCAVCGVDFNRLSNKQRACSDACRFKLYENKGADGECWEWLGNRNNQGYGVITRLINGKKKVMSAHRVSYELVHGEIPANMCVMHSCDNRCCVNPSHLSVGSWGDNNSDRSRKGRSGSRQYSDEDRAKYSKMLSGEGNPAAKITESIARSIKYDHPELTGAEMARRLGLSKTTVNQIRSGKSWANI